MYNKTGFNMAGFIAGGNRAREGGMPSFLVVEGHGWWRGLWRLEGEMRIVLLSMGGERGDGKSGWLRGSEEEGGGGEEGGGVARLAARESCLSEVR